MKHLQPPERKECDGPEFCLAYRLRVCSLFQDRARFALIARLCSGGISMGRAAPFSKSPLSFLGRAVSSCPRSTPSLMQVLHLLHPALDCPRTSLRSWNFACCQWHQTQGLHGLCKKREVSYVEHILPIPYLSSGWDPNNCVPTLQHQPLHQMLCYLFFYT